MIRVKIIKQYEGKCSNGGISEFYDEAYLLTNGEAPTEGPGLIDLPLVVITPGNLPGTIKAQRADISGLPIRNEADGKTCGPMSGGCFIVSSDSRFREECERVLGGRFDGAVSLHDRFETPEQNRILSM